MEGIRPAGRPLKKPCHATPCTLETSMRATRLLDGFTCGMKSQSIAYLLIGSAHIYWILDLEGEVHSIWDL